MNGSCELMHKPALPRGLRAVLVACAIAVAGCGSKPEPASGAAPAAPAARTSSSESAAAPRAQAPVVPAPAVTQASWSPDALEELLAPIALYPDQLLGQILAASVNAQEVLDAGNWLLQNPDLAGNELDAAAQKAHFGPAMRALVQFPTVVDMMCQQIDWTRQLGSAFTSDQKSVLDAVQRLRAQAAQAGNLESTPQQRVETKEADDKVVVEVKPADPKVVYVPQYDPQAVYTTPAPTQQPAQATTASSGTTPASSTSTQGTVSTGAAVATGLVAFGVGVILGKALEDDDDDYYYPHWGSGAVYYGPRPFYPPAYVYRPVYSPAFRPGYSYAAPPGYRHAYNNVDMNVSRNVNVNNDNYFNRFTNNQNLRAGAAQSPLRETRRAATQHPIEPPAAANRAESWRGQSTYAGARKDAATERLNEAAGAQPDARAAQAHERTARERSSSESLAGRDASSTARAREHEPRTDRTQHVDRGYGESTRLANRDTGAISRPERAAAPARDHAFSGADREGSGSFDRAASARGHASAGARPTRGEHAGRRR